MEQPQYLIDTNSVIDYLGNKIPVLGNKLENGHIDLSVEEIQKHSILFNMATDEILNYGNVIPNAGKVEKKPDIEKLHLIK